MRRWPTPSEIYSLPANYRADPQFKIGAGRHPSRRIKALIWVSTPASFDRNTRSAMNDTSEEWHTRFQPRQTIHTEEAFRAFLITTFSLTALRLNDHAASVMIFSNHFIKVRAFALVNRPEG